MRFGQRRNAHYVSGSVFSLFFLVSLLAPFSFSQSSKSASGTGAHPADLSQIEHFVFIFKENRSFDHYFGTFLERTAPPAEQSQQVRSFR